MASELHLTMASISKRPMHLRPPLPIFLVGLVASFVFFAMPMVAAHGPRIGFTSQLTRNKPQHARRANSNRTRLESNDLPDVVGFLNAAGKAFDEARRRLKRDGVVGTQDLNPEGHPVAFGDLPWQAQTAIGDLWYSMGDLRKIAPKFWNDVITGAWETAYQDLGELSRANRISKIRARRDSKLVRDAIDIGAVPDF